MAKRNVDELVEAAQGEGPSPKKTRRGDSFRFLVNSQIPGIVIGRGGQTINGIREEAGVAISISKGDSQKADRVMEVRGDASKVAHAVHLITQLIEKNNASQEEGGQSVSTDLQLLIHQLHAGAIIGRGGATVKQIMEDTGATVRLSNEALAGSTDKMVTISGSTEQLQAALTTVLTLVDQNPLRDSVEHVPFMSQGGSRDWGEAASASGAPWGAGAAPGFGAATSAYGNITPSGPQVSTELLIPTISAGAVIGKGGTTIANIKGQSSCTVSLAEPVGDQRSVSIKGPSGGVCIALCMIRNLVSQMQQGPETVVESVFTVPTAKSGQLIGKGGRTIRDIKTRTSTRISLAEPSEADPEARSVTVTGGAVAVQCAAFEIKQKIEEDPNTPSAVGQMNYGGPAATPATAAAGPSQYSQQYMQQYMQQYQAMAAYYGGQMPTEGVPSSATSMPAIGAPPTMGGAGGGGLSGVGGMGGGGEGDAKRISIPSASAGAVIGRKGATIDSIKQQSGCRISIDPASSAHPEYRCVNISGSDAGVQLATSLIAQYTSIF